MKTRTKHRTAGVLFFLGSFLTSAFAIAQVARDPQNAQDYVNYGSGGGGGGNSNGTVTSVALTAPSFLTVGGSPVTTSGTLALTLASETANTVFAAPNGAAGAPTFRLLLAADIPTTLNGTTFNGNVVIPSTNAFIWNTSTQLLAPSNGVAQILNASGTGTGAYLLVGQGTAAGGIRYMYNGSNTAYIQNGDGSSNAKLVVGSVLTGSGAYSATSAFLAMPQGYGYGLTAADATHTSLITNSLPAMAWDSAQNTVSGGNITIPSANYRGWVNTTELLSPSSGQVQVTNAAGGFGSLLFGSNAATTGVILTASNQTLTLQGGNGTQASNTGFSTGILTANNYITVSNKIYTGTGTAAAPFITNSSSGNTGVYWPTTTSFGIATNGVVGFTQDASQNTTLAGTLSGQKYNVVSKTAAYTVLLTDSGTHFDNFGATGTVAYTLPTVTKGFNACFTTTAAQTITLTTPTGAIVGASFTTGATRTVSSQYTTLCVVVHGDAANYTIESLSGTIAS